MRSRCGRMLRERIPTGSFFCTSARRKRGACECSGSWMSEDGTKARMLESLGQWTACGWSGVAVRHRSRRGRHFCFEGGVQRIFQIMMKYCGTGNCTRTRTWGSCTWCLQDHAVDRVGVQQVRTRTTPALPERATVERAISSNWSLETVRRHLRAAWDDVLLFSTSQVQLQKMMSDRVLEFPATKVQTEGKNWRSTILKLRYYLPHHRIC